MEPSVKKVPPADREAGKAKIEDYSPEKGQPAVVESSLEEEVPSSDERTRTKKRNKFRKKSRLPQRQNPIRLLQPSLQPRKMLHQT
jgi:hypothetical protein